jgi:small GTP-binding protein
MTPDGRLALSGSDKDVLVWDLVSHKCIASLPGHMKSVLAVVVTPSGRRALSASEDGTIRLWDLEAKKGIATFEGHTGPVWGVAITSDGTQGASCSADRTVRVWNLVQGNNLILPMGHTKEVYSVAMTPDGKWVSSCSLDQTICVWEVPSSTPARSATPEATKETAKYTNAKVLLVGDSGVGKTGLALRLTESRFAPTISTDAAWASQMKLPHEELPDGVEREIWLWDFAGQSDYRLIHQLFMDETALAVLVFNPQDEDPLEGIAQWERALARAARRSFCKLLVAGRCDRGGLTISRSAVERFRDARGFTRYFETSALTGAGCGDLRESIISNIPWDQIPWTASPRIFKLLKETILQLRDENKVILRVAELKQQIEMALPAESFTLDELRTVIRLLAGPGIVWQLEFGDFVLLQPERINAYAAAVIRSVRAHTDEIGCIAEERVLQGDLDYQDMKRLPFDDEQIVLRAMHQTFVDHGLCLREHTDRGPVLVFPSYYRREQSDLPEHPAILVTYQLSGALDEVYATLIVKLHNTTAFEKDQLWRFAADFRTQQGQRLGIKMLKRAEGAAELTIYCEPTIPEDTKVTFIRYVHDHLKAKDPSVLRVRHYVCAHCSEPVEGNRAIQKRLREGRTDIPCSFCGEAIALLDLIERKFTSDLLQRQVREMEQESLAKIQKVHRELVLESHAFAVSREAGQIFKVIPESDFGIDGEIEFVGKKGQPSGMRIYLILKSGSLDSNRNFLIRDLDHAGLWSKQQWPVMLVNREQNGSILWMNLTTALRQIELPVSKVFFEGEAFTALALQLVRDQVVRDVSSIR